MTAFFFDKPAPRPGSDNDIFRRSNTQSIRLILSFPGGHFSIYQGFFYLLYGIIRFHRFLLNRFRKVKMDEN
jgi:hypothetical protein